MFFFVFRSHVVGMPFIGETMLRSGVPPHIGHSLPPGSENAPAVSVPAASATARRTTLRARAFGVWSLEFGVVITLFLVPVNLDVVVVKFRAAGRIRGRIRIDS